MKLYFNVGTDFTIEDDRGAKLTIAEAKEAVEGGHVTDFNVAFGRLMREFDWNVRKARAYYDEIAKKSPFGPIS